MSRDTTVLLFRQREAIDDPLSEPELFSQSVLELASGPAFATVLYFDRNLIRRGS